MRLLMTGTTGFIGGHLTRRLLADGHDIHAVVRPETDVTQLEKQGVALCLDDGKAQTLINYALGKNFSGIIHLAACFVNQHQPEQMDRLLQTNVVFATRLLECAEKNKIPWFVNTGTFWQHFNQAGYNPVNLYAATKQAFETIAKYYEEVSGLDFVTLLLNDTYGPGDRRKKILQRWAGLARSGERMEMSPGDQVVDILHVDDVVAGFLRLCSMLENEKRGTYGGRQFALYAKERLTLKELARLFEHLTRSTLNIHWGGHPYLPREIMLPWNQGERLPGWEPKVGLRDGIPAVFGQEGDK